MVNFILHQMEKIDLLRHNLVIQQIIQATEKPQQGEQTHQTLVQVHMLVLIQNLFLI